MPSRFDVAGVPIRTRRRRRHPGSPSCHMPFSTRPSFLPLPSHLTPSIFHLYIHTHTHDRKSCICKGFITRSPCDEIIASCFDNQTILIWWLFSFSLFPPRLPLGFQHISTEAFDDVTISSQYRISSRKKKIEKKWNFLLIHPSLVVSHVVKSHAKKKKKKNRPRRLKSPRDDKSLMRAVPCRNHSSPSFRFFIFSPLRVTTDLSYSSIKR